MLDDEDLDVGADDADLPAVGALPAAGEGWPAGAAGADIAPPPYFSAPPGANAEQRRMFDMLNARGMQMYRQALQDRRSQASQRAVMERQDANRRAIMDRQEASQRAMMDRQEASQRAMMDRQALQDRRSQASQRAIMERQEAGHNAREAARQQFELRKSETEAGRRRELEQMRIRAEQRKDPNFVREEELAQLDAAEAAGRDASRRGALDTLPAEAPRAMALPLGMSAGEGARYAPPSTAMQMPEEAGRAVGNSQEALNLRMGREFGAKNLGEAATSRGGAEERLAEDYDVLDRVTKGRKLDVRAKTSPQRSEFKQDFKERIAPYEAALDGLLKEGEEEAKSGKVDEALLPKLGDPKNKNQKQRFLDLVDRVAGRNDISPDTVTRALFGMAQLPNAANAPRVLPNGAVDYNGVRFVMDADTFRMLAMMRAERLKEINDSAAAAKARTDAVAAAGRQAIVRRRLDIDDADTLERDAMASRGNDPIFSGAQTKQQRSKFEAAMRRMREMAGKED